MAKLVLDQAQIAMDDYYLKFRSSTDFFTLEDFARKIVDERDGALELEFKVQFQQNKRSFPLINPAWTIHETVDLKQDENNKWYGKICTALFDFPDDDSGAAVQQVVPFGARECAQFLRIKDIQSWQICLAPPTDIVFYSIEKCTINLYNFFGCTDKLDVQIVPSQSALPLEQQTVPDGKAAQIREVVMNKMFRDYQVKIGKVLMHNDGNQNPQPNESGLNYEALKTK